VKLFGDPDAEFGCAGFGVIKSETADELTRLLPADYGELKVGVVVQAFDGVGDKQRDICT